MLGQTLAQVLAGMVSPQDIRRLMEQIQQQQIQMERLRQQQQPSPQEYRPSSGQQNTPAMFT